MESSIAGTHDEMLQVLKEKMRLEGQLEALSLEANQVENEFEFQYLANDISILINFQEPAIYRTALCTGILERGTLQGYCDELTLAGHQVPTRDALSLPLLCWKGEDKKVEQKACG